MNDGVKESTVEMNETGPRSGFSDRIRIGVFSKNQMTATSIVMPVMLIFAFSPMLAMFNENIEKVARFAYTQQFKKIMDDMSFAGIKIDNICILAINAMLMMALFFIAFRKKGLE